MNKEFVLFNLREAKEEIERTIADIESNNEYELVEFQIAMQHLYHHLNTAWNARNATAEAAEQCSQVDFVRWRQFPADIDMSV